MYILLLRTFILYFLVILTLRLMGKKQIGELQPYELAITIMVSELASLPMQDIRIPILHGIIPIITLLFLQTILSILELKSEKFRGILNGKPSILISHGKMNINELKNQQFTINDLLEELRLKNFYNIEDIEFAILETNGQLSVIPKTYLTPVAKEDMNIQSKQDMLPIVLILNGKINFENLKASKKTEKWLRDKLKKANTTVSNVFVALINSKGELYFENKQDNKNKGC